MNVAGRIVAGLVAGAFVLAGGYVVADIHDFVPGYLTLAPAPPTPNPFPTVEVPAVASTLDVALPPIGTDGPLPASSAISQMAEDFAQTTDMLGERVAVMVSDSFTGEVLGQVNQDLAMIPASVQKLITGAAAVQVLDTDRTLKTKVLHGGGSDIYLVGEGDMLLGAQGGNPNALNGRAGLADLASATAQQLKANGLTSVELFLDDTIFTGSMLGPWEEDLVTQGFTAPVATLAIDVGREKEGMYAPRFLDPALKATQAFATLLAEQGIEVTAFGRGTFQSPGQGVTVTDDRVIAQIESAPLGEIIDYAMKISDNTLTEVLGFTVARELGLEASFTGATTAVVQVMDQLGVSTSGMNLADCSGLGRTSYVTARSINDLMNVMVSADNPKLREAAIGLAIAGLDGTLEKRFVERNGRGLVRGKTGSLNNVTSLAGTVVTADNRLLTFVLLADQTPGGQYGPRTTIDKFVEQLAQCGCTQ